MRRQRLYPSNSDCTMTDKLRTLPASVSTPTQSAPTESDNSFPAVANASVLCRGVAYDRYGPACLICPCELRTNEHNVWSTQLHGRNPATRICHLSFAITREIPHESAKIYRTTIIIDNSARLFNLGSKADWQSVSYTARCLKLKFSKKIFLNQSKQKQMSMKKIRKVFNNLLQAAIKYIHHIH